MNQDAEQSPETGEVFTGSVVPLTPEVLAKIREGIAAHTERKEQEFPRLVRECPYATRLAVAAWTMEHIVEHARSGGSFRYLIYERLGFDFDAYVPLYLAGGMTISNEFSLHASAMDDTALASSVRRAAELVPLEQRQALLQASFRLEDLAAFAATSRELLDKQRREIDELIRGAEKQ